MKKSWNCPHLSHLAFWKSALAEKLERGTLWCTFKNIFPTEERNCCIARLRGEKCTVRRSRRPWWRGGEWGGGGGGGAVSKWATGRSECTHHHARHEVTILYYHILILVVIVIVLRYSDLAQLWYWRRALSQKKILQSITRGLASIVLGAPRHAPGCSPIKYWNTETLRYWNTENTEMLRYRGTEMLRKFRYSSLPALPSVCPPLKCYSVSVSRWCWR